MGSLRNSLTKGTRNTVGFLGEDMLAEWCEKQGKVKLTHVDKYDFDFVSPSGLRIEVKTKTRTGAPAPHFDNTVMTTNDRQKCDVYVFLQLVWTSNRTGEIYFCGFMDAQHFRKVAITHQAGQLSGTNGFVPRASQRSVPIQDCRDLDDFIFSCTSKNRNS